MLRLLFNPICHSIFFYFIFITALYASPKDFKFDRTKPIEVLADQLTVSDDQKIGEFLGNVHIIQDKYRLKAHRVVINYTDQKKQNNLIKTITAYKNVYLSAENEQVAKSQKMEYDLSSKILTLSGGVFLTYDNNILKGNNIVLNTQTNHVKVNSSKNQRVRASINLPVQK